MPDRTDHRHCKVCGNVCGTNERYCSPKCETQRADALRQRRNLMTLMYASIAVLVLLLVLQLSHA